MILRNLTYIILGIFILGTSLPCFTYSDCLPVYADDCCDDSDTNKDCSPLENSCGVCLVWYIKSDIDLDQSSIQLTSFSIINLLKIFPAVPDGIFRPPKA